MSSFLAFYMTEKDSIMQILFIFEIPYDQICMQVRSILSYSKFNDPNVENICHFRKIRKTHFSKQSFWCL